MNWDEKAIKRAGLCRPEVPLANEPGELRMRGEAMNIRASEYRGGFEVGARWQREELRTSESVEVVALSLLHSDWPSDEADREYHWKHFADSYREKASAAVTAILGEG